MVKLVDTDIRTREVVTWKGLHLLNFSESSCSQKTRIALNLKGLEWRSHEVNLGLQENYSPWFLGINPRGLVPVLVHDGDVHIESNDILTYLDNTFKDRPLIPEDKRDYINKYLLLEDQLHMDLRTLTMRFLVPKITAKKSPRKLLTYQENKGTVSGRKDPQKEVELKFWRAFERNGITDTQVIESFNKFRTVYHTLDASLEGNQYLSGDQPTLMDIAWFIYTDRLSDAGYPFSSLHPRIHTWYRHLNSRVDFSKEVKSNIAITLVSKALKMSQVLRKRTLADITKTKTNHS